MRKSLGCADWPGTGHDEEVECEVGRLVRIRSSRWKRRGFRCSGEHVAVRGMEWGRRRAC